MQFIRIRLEGFKSFVEPTELDISEGMTGIVGPNGCGKSNLVEALRWGMGETSYKNMRAGCMDDVIFAGTSMRPSRNLASVMIELDNSHRLATAEFNNDDTLIVTREIERGGGSDYNINGRPVRQRDIQLLFADMGAGSHSSSMVGQGQIDALVRAKPQDRRRILEEASGTSGLQARRHEAELKLKAAEQNLTRLDDVRNAHETQLKSLRQQIRQASRYRNLAEHIRRTEAMLLDIRWKEGEAQTVSATEMLAVAEQRVNEALSLVTQGTTRRTEQASELPALRQAEAAAAAIVQKLTLDREQTEKELARVTAELQAARQRLAQAQDDQSREKSRLMDGENALTRLGEEILYLEESRQNLNAAMPEAIQKADTLAAEVEKRDQALTQTLQTIAGVEARSDALRKEISSLAGRLEGLSTKRDELDKQRAYLAAEAATRPDLGFARALFNASETELARRQVQSQAAEQNVQEAQALQQQAQEIYRQADTALMRLRAEAEALLALLQPHDANAPYDAATAQQVIDVLKVVPGYENALAVALGEALTASLDPSAPMYWREMMQDADQIVLPQGIQALSRYIDAPPQLRHCLAQIGIVDDNVIGERAAESLKPGQIIVSREGWAWRWDGLVTSPLAKTATALRLQQRNRLAALSEEVAYADSELRQTEQALANANSFLTARQEEDKRAREALKAAFTALTDARDTLARQEKEATAITTKLAAVDETLDVLNQQIADIRIQILAAEDGVAALPQIDDLRAGLQEERTSLAEMRSALGTAVGNRDQLRRDYDAAEKRLNTVKADRSAWQDRLAEAQSHVEALTQRITETEAVITGLEQRPAEIDARRGELLTLLSDAEATRRAAADALMFAETQLTETERDLKRSETALGEARENRVRLEAALQAANEHLVVLRVRIAEKLSITPEELSTSYTLAEGEVLPAPYDLEQALGRYTRERDGMGPVNLLAETEADTLQAEMDKLQQDRDDLVAAIAKLRQGINQLNKEARERLLAAFTQVNERFQTLFTRLFNGGKAHLELQENEDPALSGLEIYASPPGKKMQILTLLSGGERTLTALALLFAVFQTNPSPICVLDEAEAALDESNIDRFCSLVEDIARETGTRFLVITHQRLTMARMNRLYGVTMGEKGVSQLVSVDLEKAISIRDKAFGDMDQVHNAEAALAAVQAA